MGSSFVMTTIPRRTRNTRDSGDSRSTGEEHTLKASGCSTFPCTVVDNRMTAVSGQYWYQFTLML